MVAVLYEARCCDHHVHREGAADPAHIYYNKVGDHPAVLIKLFRNYRFIKTLKVLNYYIQLYGAL